jgi:pimeloyl-ACP methyl ester carboxylesterase
MPSDADIPSRANRLDQVGERRRVLRVWQTARVGPATRQIEYMQFGADGLRPLIFLHSLEYPNCPSWGFCVDAATAGFGTFAVRRPGFGASDRVGDVEAQVQLLTHFLDEADLEDVIIVAIGSACPVGYRLAAATPRVTYSVYVNCVFNRDVLGEFRPPWFGPLLAQALQNPAGARLSLGALRQIAKQFGPKWFYEAVAQKSPGDLAFVRDSMGDIEAAWAVGSVIHADTFRDEMRYSLSDDPFLTDGVMASLKGLALSGAETTASWKAGFESEARRIGLPWDYLPSGDIFAAYCSGDALLQMLRTHA